MRTIRNVPKRASGALAVVLIFALGGDGRAQEVSSAEFAIFLEAMGDSVTPLGNTYLPGISSATVAPNGTAYASGTLMNPRTGTAGLGLDASTSFGVGFGDAAEGIGASLQVNVTGVQPFGTDGDFSLRFSTKGFGNTYVGLGLKRLAGWGGNASIAPVGEVMVTHFSSMGSLPFMVTFGASTDGDADYTQPGFFAGIGFGLTESVGFGVSIKHERLNAGFGVKVPNVDGLSITADVSNINRRNPGGSSPGKEPIYSIGVHYAFRDLF